MHVMEDEGWGARRTHPTHPSCGFAAEFPPHTRGLSAPARGCSAKGPRDELCAAVTARMAGAESRGRVARGS